MTFVVFLVLLLFVLSLVGVINPKWFLLKGKRVYTRKQMTYITLGLFVIFVILSDSNGGKSSKPTEAAASKSPPSTATTTLPTVKQTALPSATASPTATPAPIKKDDFAAQFKPEVTAVASNGGLGDTFAQIEKVLGKATRTNIAMKDGAGQYNYQDDFEVVMYIEGRVQSIGYQLDTKKKSMSEKDALEFAKSVMPADATFVKKYDKDNMERIYVYHSKSLEGLFSDEWFKDDNGKVNPGEFGISLSHDGDTVDAFTAAIGL